MSPSGGITLATYRTNASTGRSRRIPVASVEDVEFVVKNEVGEPCAGWFFCLVDPDGTRRTGQLDGEGRGRVEQVSRGACRLQVTQEPLSAPS